MAVHNTLTLSCDRVHSICRQALCENDQLAPSDPMHESMHTTTTRHAPRTSPMVALARELGAAELFRGFEFSRPRISVGYKYTNSV